MREFLQEVWENKVIGPWMLDARKKVNGYQKIGLKVIRRTRYQAKERKTDGGRRMSDEHRVSSIEHRVQSLSFELALH